jgi:hypothetical protein
MQRRDCSIKSLIKHVFVAERKVFQAAPKLSVKTALDNEERGV